jgi:hypothetical protein
MDTYYIWTAEDARYRGEGIAGGPENWDLGCNLLRLLERDWICCSWPL